MSKLIVADMPNKTNENAITNWVNGELRLAGALDGRMMGLLKAIEDSGSINQAAKQVGLSYKGAWQMIERANNISPKALVATATGGSKGGGTCLTAAGKSLLQLFTRLEQQHQTFLRQLNQSLADDPDVMLLLKPMAIKTSATNQLFGIITAIKLGAVIAEVFVALKGGDQVVTSLALSEVAELNLGIGGDVLLLINASEINVFIDPKHSGLSARNCLHGSVVRIQKDRVDSEIVIQLSGGDSLVATITQVSADALGLQQGDLASAVFKSNAVILGALAGSATKTKFAASA